VKKLKIIPFPLNISKYQNGRFLKKKLGQKHKTPRFFQKLKQKNSVFGIFKIDGLPICAQKISL